MSRKRGERRRAREEKPEKKNRIIADQSKQAPNNSYGPPAFYEDHEFTCVDCGNVETWTAEQQQWWYEVAKGPVDSRAIRCSECRENDGRHMVAHRDFPTVIEESETTCSESLKLNHETHQTHEKSEKILS